MMRGEFMNKQATMIRSIGGISIPGARDGAPEWVYETHASEDLPVGLDGKTVAFLTDIHINRFWKDEALNHLIDRIGAMSPDLLLWGGDYAEGDAHARRLFTAAARLNPPLGMYGVIGNNDYESFDGKMNELIKLMKRSRIFPLINKSSARDVEGGRLIISGADEPKYGFPNSRMLRGQVKKGDFRILVCHSPQAVDIAVDGIAKKPDLVLCGHTHGGQVSCLGLTIYSFGYERRRHKDNKYFFVRGVRQIDGMRIIVSNGVGMSTLPLRIGTKSELHLIRLERKS